MHDLTNPSPLWSRQLSAVAQGAGVLESTMYAVLPETRREWGQLTPNLR